MATVSALIIACCASNLFASIVDYTIDPAQSSLTASSSWGCIPLQYGNLASSLSGSLQADVTASTLQFLGGDVGVNNSYSGSFDSFWQFLVAMDASFRDVSLQLTSDPIALNNGSFAANSATVTADGIMDYQGTGIIGFFLLGWGSSPISDQGVGNSTFGTGTISSDGTTEKLTIPVTAGIGTGTQLVLIY